MSSRVEPKTALIKIEIVNLNGFIRIQAMYRKTSITVLYDTELTVSDNVDRSMREVLSASGIRAVGEPTLFKRGSFAYEYRYKKTHLIKD